MVKKGEKWKTYKIKKKLKTIFSIYIDREDNKWISTEQALIVYNEQGVLGLKTKEQITTPYFTIKNNSEIEYFLSNSSKVEIKIYNNQGELIEIILEENMLKGKHLFYYNTDSLTTGYYFCKFKTEKLSETKRIIVMK